jgi:hypothetical protein
MPNNITAFVSGLIAKKPKDFHTDTTIILLTLKLRFPSGYFVLLMSLNQRELLYCQGKWFSFSRRT